MGILDYIFQIFVTEDVSVKHKISYLAILSSKSKNDIVNIINKSDNVVRKTKNYLKKPQMTKLFDYLIRFNL